MQTVVKLLGDAVKLLGDIHPHPPRVSASLERGSVEKNMSLSFRRPDLLQIATNACSKEFAVLTVDRQQNVLFFLFSWCDSSKRRASTRTILPELHLHFTVVL